MSAIPQCPGTAPSSTCEELREEASRETVFRKHWHDRQSAGARPGELIRQPGWVDAGLVALGVLLAAGAVAAATITVSRTTAMSAVAQGTSVTAGRGETAPTPGAAARYRDSAGTTLDAVVVEVTETEVVARLDRSAPASTGELLVPAGRQRLIGVLLPRLG